jgi:hypothetical protein
MKIPTKMIEKGKNLYLKLKPKLEKKYEPQQYVSIEVNSGQYFVGKNSLEAITKAQKKFPKKQFFLAQVGKLAGSLK